MDARVDGTLMKGPCSRPRWQGMLDSGANSSIEELARAERINASYLARLLRLILLAPDIVNARFCDMCGRPFKEQEKSSRAVWPVVGC